FGSPQFSPVAPVLLPMAHTSGPPKWLYGVLGILVVLGGAMGIVMYRLIAARPPVAVPLVGPAVAVSPPVARPPAPPPARAVTPPNTPPPSSTEPLPPREDRPI